MNKYKKTGAILLVAAMTAGTFGSMPVLADAQKVVTLGADLTEDQKTAILKYFGIYGNASVETLTITNTDERNHLASYVPIEQIGTRTFSCAFVNPTSSGGIQVKTANLSWVTGNMIASTLSTAGVTNCEVVAASPFEVSGTGALTGVIMAYEEAIGESLDSAKVEIATQELVTTGTIANEVGQTTATNIVNDIKIQVIEGQVVDSEEVADIVDEVIENSTVTIELSEEDRKLLNDLANQIAQQQYNYEDVKETLQRVEENTTNNTNNNTNNNSTVINISNDGSSSSNSDADSSSSNTDTVNADASANTDASANSDAASENTDSILDKINVSELEDYSGSDVITTSTDETETEAQSETTVTDDSGIAITTSDEYTDQSSGETQETQAETQQETQAETSAEVSAETPIDIVSEDVTVVDENAQIDQAQSDDAQTDGQYQEENAEAVEQNAAAEVEEEAELVLAAEPVIETDANVIKSGIIKIYIPKMNIVPLEGAAVTVADSNGSQTATVSLTDADLVSVTDMTSEQLIEKGWSSEAGGTVISVLTKNAFYQDANENVTFDINVYGQIAESVDGVQGASTDMDVYTDVTLAAEDNWNLVQVYVDTIKDLKAGNTLSASYSWEGIDTENGYYAAVSEYNPEMVALYDTDGGFAIDLIKAGTTTITVTEYDVDGNPVGSEVIALTILN